MENRNFARELQAVKILMAVDYGLDANLRKFNKEEITESETARRNNRFLSVRDSVLKRLSSEEQERVAFAVGVDR